MKKHIDEIKKKLIGTSDYEESISYFLTYLFHDKRIFKKIVKKRDYPVLIMGLKKSLTSQYKYHLKKLGKSTDNVPDEINPVIKIFGILQYGFFHGTILFDKGYGSFLYFKKEGVGVLAMTYSDTSETAITRFTAIEHEAGTMPMFYNRSKDIN